MNINTDLGFAWVCAIFGAVFLIGVAMLNQLQTNTVAKEVANEPVTETEVYKVVCVAPADGYCKEYSVRRLNRE